MVKKMEEKVLIEMKKITCPRCSYTWYSKSKLLYVTCPNCFFKIKTKGET
ncbi:MAG: hypothetical protein QXL14_03530 [Candidatus Aenigmatarchaeota archaeon]